MQNEEREVMLQILEELKNLKSSLSMIEAHFAQNPPQKKIPKPTQQKKSNQSDSDSEESESRKVSSKSDKNINWACKVCDKTFPTP